MFIVVLNVDKNNNYFYSILPDNLAQCQRQVPVAVVNGENNFSNYVVSNRLVPLNFSIDRHGELVQDMGIFKRFERAAFVVVSELVSKAGVVKGYKVARVVKNHNATEVLNITKEELLKFAELSGEVIFQNAIVRNNAVTCFPQKPFQKVVIATAPKQAKSSKEDKSADSKKSVKRSKVTDKDFTEQQMHEIISARQAGLDSKFLENPELSPKQMRVLWVSKKNGALSEYFADPRFDVDAMKFYADRLFTKDIVKDCADMLKKPELSLDMLRVLFNCVIAGIDYSDIVDMNIGSAELAYVQRSKNFWSSITVGDLDDLYLCALNVVNDIKMKG